MLEGWDGATWVTVHTIVNASAPSEQRAWSSDYQLRVQREHCAKLTMRHGGRNTSASVSTITLWDLADNRAFVWKVWWSEKKYVFNCFLDGGWMHEIAKTDFYPWASAPSENPVLEIAISAESFKVGIGGVWLNEFEYPQAYGVPVWQASVSGWVSPQLSWVVRPQMAWRPVFRQKLPGRFSAGQWSRSPYEPLSDSFAALDTLDRHRFDGDLTFRMSWPGENLHEQVWVQNSNPVLVDIGAYTDSFRGIWDFAPVLVPYTAHAFAGLHKSTGTESLLDGVSKNGHTEVAWAVGIRAAIAAPGPCYTQADWTPYCKTAQKFALDFMVDMSGWELRHMAQKGAEFRRSIRAPSLDAYAMLRNVTGIVFRLLVTDSTVQVGITTSANDDSRFPNGCHLLFKDTGTVAGDSGDVSQATRTPSI